MTIVQKIRAYFDLMLRFEAGRTTAADVKDKIRTGNLRQLDEMLAPFDVQDVPLPPPASPSYVPASVKENYHVQSRLASRRCWEIKTAEERASSFVHPDPGGPPFAAGRPSRCDGCSEPILPGDLIVVRQRIRRQA